MCSLLGVTPKQLGALREEDPVGVLFLERSFIHRRVKENEAREKAHKEAEKARAKSRHSRRR